MNEYLAPIVQSFHENSNSENAFWMKKYLKERFEFLGIKKPERAVLQKQFFSEFGLPNTVQLASVARELYAMGHREFQYLAIDLLEKSTKNWNEEIIDLFEELISTKSWWDTVDLLAGKHVGKYFKTHPEKTNQYINKWNKSNNMWLVRSSILFQLNYKELTNKKFLFDCVFSHLGSNEFFIQKAIGWALRQYARHDAIAVLKFVNNNNLKPLSKREALKHVDVKGL